MATTNALPAQNPSAGGEFARLRAESRRLRRELLCSGLEISYTIATFSESSPSRVFDESWRNAARKTLSRLEMMLPPDTEPDAEVTEKLNRLRAALEGSVECSAEAKHERIFNEAARNGNRDVEVPLDPLTRRETEVLRYIAQGNSTKKVAEILGIAFKTAACHRYRVMDKLGIHETANLVRYAIRHGMVDP
jgi:DNA-binding CsgD family transcriptional regulator